MIEGAPSADTEKMAVLREVMTLKVAQAYNISRDEYMRRDALIDRTCKLDLYMRPGEPLRGEQLGTPLGMSPAELLMYNIKFEEAEWSRCYKMIMTYGR